MAKKYLENPICHFKQLFEIDYSQKKNVVSASFFKMYGGGYKDFSLYLNGIGYLSQFIKNEAPEFVLRLFIEKSIYQDKKIMDRLTKLDNLEMVLYDCPEYKANNSKHRGIFGMFVRFFPIFDFPNNDAQMVIISDLDWKSYHDIKNRHVIFQDYRTLKQKNLLSDLRIFIHGRLFHQALKSNFIKKNDMIVPYILSWKFLNNLKIDHQIIIDFIGQIDQNPKLQSNYIGSENNAKALINKSHNNKIIFGIDEYFLNHTLVDHLIDNKLEFATLIKYTLTGNIYFMKSTNNKKKESYLSTFYKFILNEINNFQYQSPEQAFQLMDKYTYLEYAKNKSLNQDQITIFNRVYIFYIKIYHHPELSSFFNKNFLKIVLSDQYLGKVYLQQYRFYYSNKEDVNLECIQLPEKDIQRLRQYKEESKIPKILVF